MKPIPLISIGVPTYNHAYFLHGALRSLLSQTYKNIEIIISNNASNDDTKVLCKRFAKKDKRIRYFEQKDNLGPGSNFIFVLSKARGTYFMWAGDDDLWHKDYILKLITELMKHPSAVLAVSVMKNYSLKRQNINYLNYKTFEPSIRAITKFLLHPTYIGNLFYGVYRTSIIKKVGMHRDSRPYFGNSSDILTVFKVLLKGDLIYIPEIMFFKRDTGYYFTITKNLVSLQFSKSIISHITIYLLFPIGHIYDLYYSIIATIQSHLRLRDKLLIIICIIMKLIRDMVWYVYDIGRGVFSLVKGIFLVILRGTNMK